jgi:hypothetical protein
MPETTVDKTRYIRKTVDTCNSKLAEFAVSDKQLYSVLPGMRNPCSCKKNLQMLNSFPCVKLPVKTTLV